MAAEKTRKNAARSVLEEAFITDRMDRDVARVTAEHRIRALGARFRSVPEPGAGTDPRTAQTEYARLHARAEELLTTDPAAWADVRELEATLILLIGPEEVDAELARALVIAAKENVPTPSEADLAKFQSPGVDAPARRRALLSNLIGDIQWVHQKKFLRRELRNKYSASISKFGLWFVLPLLVIALDMTSGGPEVLFWCVDKVRAWWTDGAAEPMANLLQEANTYFAYPGLPLSVAAGVLGAWFSMLVSIDSRLSDLSLDELRAARRSAVIWARLAFGAGASLILYFLVRSGLLSGDLFPDVTAIGFVHSTEVAATTAVEAALAENAVAELAGVAPSTTVETAAAAASTQGAGLLVPTTDLCLLLIWGVIAGFSESFIPAALTKNSEEA